MGAVRGGSDAGVGPRRTGCSNICLLLLLLLLCMGEGKEILKFDGGEEIKPCIECTYLGTKIDQLGDNTTEIKQN